MRVIFLHPPKYEALEKTPEDSNSEVNTQHNFFTSGKLNVDVRTNKGGGPLYYTEGETMTVFGRVNQPSYLRLLYILADGKRTLLQDNYYIDASKVDTDVKIGEFVCAPPFGTELLIVTARAEAFPPIETYEKDGYVFLVDQDAESVARSFRGMKQKSDKQEKQQMEEQQMPNIPQSDAQLVLTTMEK